MRLIERYENFTRQLEPIHLADSAAMVLDSDNPAAEYLYCDLNNSLLVAGDEDMGLPMNPVEATSPSVRVFFDPADP